MNKIKSSSVAIELIKLIDIFKISGHGHAIERLGFKESEYNTYLEIDCVIDKLIKTHQEEMIDKLCLDNECWSKANSLSVHNFLNILQAEKLSKMLSLTQEEIKKTTQKTHVAKQNQHSNSINTNIDITHDNVDNNYENSNTSVLNGQVQVLDRRNLSHYDKPNEINDVITQGSISSINTNKSKMSVSTGLNLNSKIYTANAKSRHLPSIPQENPKNMLSNYVFSGTTSTVDVEVDEKKNK